MDNSKLEELMKEEITPEMQKEFFELFKESQLFMPVTFSENMFKEIENAQLRTGYRAPGGGAEGLGSLDSTGSAAQWQDM